MANRDCTTNEPTSAIENKPFHEDFSWLSDNLKTDPNARFAAKVKSVTSGCGTIASIVQQHLLDQETSTRTLLSDRDIGALVALIEPLMSMLEEAADSQIRWIEKYATKGGVK